MRNLHLILGLLVIVACGDTGNTPLADASSMDGGVPQDTPTARDGGVSFPDDTGPLAEFCMGNGPLLIPTGTRERCSGQVAVDVFRYAVCSCGDLELNGDLQTDSFDSASGAFSDGETGASVGSNGMLQANGAVVVSGVLYATTGIDTNDAISVGTDLYTGGDVDPTGDSPIGRNAFVGGDVLGDLGVAGTLTMPEGGDEGDATYAELVRAPVNVTDPCTCEEESRPDVSGLVAAYAASNDNALIDLDPAALTMDGTGIDLPCGRYFLSHIDASGDVTIRIEGRVALFIGGDVEINGGLDVEMAEGSELDVFIDGNISANGALAFGDATRPAASRIYVNGTSFALNGDAELVGNVYAPAARFSTNGDAETFGSLVVGMYDVNGEGIFHYDRAILDIGDQCETPPTECAGCGDCGELACVDGMCGACQQDSDCCSPLICFEGECTPLLI